MGSEPDPERDRRVKEQYRKIGRLFELLRKASGHSQTKVARDAGMARSTLDGVEKARGNPELETILKIAHALNVPVDDVLKQALERPLSDFADRG